MCPPGQHLLDLPAGSMQSGDDSPAVGRREVMDAAQVQPEQGEGDRRAVKVWSR